MVADRACARSEYEEAVKVHLHLGPQPGHRNVLVSPKLLCKLLACCRKSSYITLRSLTDRVRLSESSVRNHKEQQRSKTNVRSFSANNPFTVLSSFAVS